MHEFSIVQSLIATCKRVAKEHEADEVLEIHITAGRLAGIEPHFIEAAFEILREGTICENSSLHVDIQEIEALCNSCQTNFSVKNFRFVCPSCGGDNIEITKGKGLIIDHIELR